MTFTSADRVRDLIRNFNTAVFDSLHPKYRGRRPKICTMPERAVMVAQQDFRRLAMHHGRILVYALNVALNIKNDEVERLAAEVAHMTGESKTEAIRRALAERRQRLAYRISPGDRRAHALRFLEHEVWPRIPEGQLGRSLSRSEEDEILGYGPEGV